ncbi:hypothetical protein PAXRUDRAFT_481870 [Paxillus rubicundulus Ve08.2h10]|uniref:Uncharacterized protein n=1 Tax=Paxillus rubicundulus Ve08.2h10 TaxID=930991 RepID=A0A0D0DPQ0_9AGAM|nr:hypothetical protein PAXRUDRAFT_481870 [Paxillus rubicundulus Ve08.2h10]
MVMTPEEMCSLQTCTQYLNHLVKQMSTLSHLDFLPAFFLIPKCLGKNCWNITDILISVNSCKMQCMMKQKPQINHSMSDLLKRVLVKGIAHWLMMQ